MTNFMVIFLSLAAGIMLQRSNRFPPMAAQAFNSFVIFLAYPAVILVQFPLLLATTPVDQNLLIPVSMAWICFAVSWMTFSIFGKKMGWSRATTGALVLTAGLGNTSFVGFPLLDALLGPEAVRIGILNDQLGSFLVLSTLGIITAASFGGTDLSLRSIAFRVFTFPPFLALLFSVIWFLSGTPGFDFFRSPLERIASTLVPVALFAVGLQMNLKLFDLKKHRFELGIGLLFKLILFPALLYGFYKMALGEISFVTHVTILESAMAPMITSAIVASEFGLESRLANLMVGVGIPLSLITVPLWNFLLQS